MHENHEFTTLSEHSLAGTRGGQGGPPASDLDDFNKRGREMGKRIQGTLDQGIRRSQQPPRPLTTPLTTMPRIGVRPGQTRR